MLFVLIILEICILILVPILDKYVFDEEDNVEDKENLDYKSRK